MSVGVVGLGQIGGSVCRALKAFTDKTVCGMDIDGGAVESALYEGAIDAPLYDEGLASCETVIVALYPEAAISFIQSHAASFAPA
jgi:prephenate dehydrogenase